MAPEWEIKQRQYQERVRERMGSSNWNVWPVLLILRTLHWYHSDAAPTPPLI